MKSGDLRRQLQQTENPDPRKINLALQGGGAHGAFTWGVLDRLLEEVEAGRLEIDGISGTSAGALNGAVLKYGLATGGPKEARRLLNKLWTGVSQKNLLTPLQDIATTMTGSHNLDSSPTFAWLEVWKHYMSPQQFNPLNQNPLRALLQDVVDFDKLREKLAEEGGGNLFIGATNVTRGDLKIFCGDEISVDSVLASATLPDLFHPMEIDGEIYWDGGYMGNPPLEPLRFDSESDDTILVQINSFKRNDAPRSRSDIADAANKLMFNSALVTELRDLERMNDLFATGKLKPSNSIRPQRMHRIKDSGAMDDLNLSSKGNPTGRFLRSLRELGRKAADEWIAENAAKLGKESTWQFDWSNPIGLLGKSEPKKPEDRRGRLQRLAGDVLNKGEGDDPGPIMPRLVKPESAPVPETPAQPLRRTIGSP
ncbi:MAG: hypothetical protein CL558_09990 [Alphaproteobacteria bacterium]|nr:hypothetical protein [Alphaproteobacteria bacterium]